MVAGSVDDRNRDRRRPTPSHRYDTGRDRDRGRSRRHHTRPAGRARAPAADQLLEELAARLTRRQRRFLLPLGPGLVLQADRRHRHRRFPDRGQPAAQLPAGLDPAGRDRLDRADLHPAHLWFASGNGDRHQRLHGGDEHRDWRFHGRGRPGHGRIWPAFLHPRGRPARLHLR